jgi:hypothetical protein
MKKKSLCILVEIFALCSAIAFACSFIDPWAIVACLMFGSAAAVTKLFHNVAEN